MVSFRFCSINRYHLPRSWYYIVKNPFFVCYFILSSVIIFFYATRNNVKSDIADWEQLFELYPGLIEPLRQTRTSSLSKRKIYIITPSKTRPEQHADLTRVAQTFSLIPNLFWIVIEDEPVPSDRLHRLLESFDLPFVHLNKATPTSFKTDPKQPTWRQPRGVLQRNLALEWLRTNTNPDEDALVYFADDDNTYHWKLFQEIRKVQSVGVWPVGLSGELLYERPICLNGRVHSWFRIVFPKRKYPIDMAGFALHLRLFHEHSTFIFNVSATSIARQESQLLDTMTTIDKLECLANNASKIYVWHTQTVSMFLSSNEKMSRVGMTYDQIE